MTIDTNPAVYHSPYGPLYLGATQGCVTLCDWIAPTTSISDKVDDSLIATLRGMLDEYFAGCRKEFPLPLREGATPFARRVLRTLEHVPYGTTVSYSQLAKMTFGNSRAVRAVAQAMAKNVITVVRPCHRVIATTGGVGGYRGGSETKAALIELERAHI